MRILVEKIPTVPGNHSFTVREFKLPIFDAPLHVHPECELTYIVQGQGRRVVGDSVELYSAGDLVLIGPNVPHCWYSDQLPEPAPLSHSIVVQFVPSFLGASFFDLPEMGALNQLLESASRGLCLTPPVQAAVAGRMTQLLTAGGAARIVLLLDILDQIAGLRSHRYLASAGFTATRHPTDSARINRVFQYVFDHFQQNVSLSEAAAIANMNPPAFCYYFKKRTRRSFSEFVNEIRIGHACKLLMNSDKTVAEICYESGFNNIAYFNRRFQQSQQVSPTAYRKRLTNREPV